MTNSNTELLVSENDLENIIDDLYGVMVNLPALKESIKDGVSVGIFHDIVSVIERVKLFVKYIESDLTHCLNAVGGENL